MRGRLLFPVTLGLVLAGAFVSRQPVIPVSDAFHDGHLRPTRHPPLPVALDDFWLVPSELAAGADAPSSGLGKAVRRVAESPPGDEAALAALLITARSPRLERTVLADYGLYYTGTALRGLARLEDAQVTFEALRQRRPAGWLAEAVLWCLADVAEAQEDWTGAVRWYRSLADRRPERRDEALLGLGRHALAAGEHTVAIEAFDALYYDTPLSAHAAEAGEELRRLRPADGPGTRAEAGRDLERAQRLFEAGRHEAARQAFTALRTLVPEDRRELVDLRLAASEVSLRRYASVVERLRPYLDGTAPPPEARLLYASAQRELGNVRDFIDSVRTLVTEYPDSSWSATALDRLATHHILVDEDADAAAVFGRLYDRDPTGPYAERAAWQYGWWEYVHGQPAESVRVFEGAAAAFPRSDYRPAYLYWSGRAHERRRDPTTAVARYRLAVIDYGSSYYGRLAAARLDGLAAVASASQAPPVTDGARSAAQEATSTMTPVDRGTVGARPASSVPSTVPLIRALLRSGLFDDALEELRRVQRSGGDSSVLQATVAWVRNRRGELRPGINAMKRAYPHYLTARGMALPRAIREVLYPLRYWEAIQRAAGARDLDPHLVAALVAQESNFQPDVRSAADAYGLMQLIPATGRRIARTLGIRGVSPSSLTQPDLNLRLGTTYLASLLDEFGQPHLALAGYNAGERRVRRWRTEYPDLEVDEFVEAISFPETRNYVKRVLGTAEDYRLLYGGHPLPSGNPEAAVASPASDKDPG